ncbi:MAG: prepilin-type N-terminal cleavage/methylation domain-containing protein [Candidatus Marinimicrobia bacterium]|nr:prepilin-type N-terminal cleavage/methylation domain-containing protein [Candidatus Neomarinimicrobiota bacterium]
MPRSESTPKRGFTLPELLVALFLFVIISGSIYGVVFGSLLQIQAGTSQIIFNARARQTQQRLTRLVQQSKYFQVVDGRTLHLFDPDNRRTVFRYEDLDNNQETLADNRLVQRAPNGDEEVLATAITPVTIGQPIFTVGATGSREVRFAFHVGDFRQGTGQRYGTGPGYQGVIVRFSAAPRNLQRWYD